MDLWQSLKMLSVLDWGAICIPAILGFLGIYIAVKPPDAKRNGVRNMWIGAFAGLGVLGALWCAVQLGVSRREEEHNREVLNDQINGGHGYCLLTAMQPTDLYPGPEWRLMVQNDNDVALQDVVIQLRERPSRSDPESVKLDKFRNVKEMKLGTVRHGGTYTDYSVLPGSYQLDIYTRNERFTEMMRVYPNDTPGALHKWHYQYEVSHFPDGKVLRTISDHP